MLAFDKLMKVYDEFYNYALKANKTGARQWAGVVQTPDGACDVFVYPTESLEVKNG